MSNHKELNVGVSVVLPVYNEQETIVEVIDQVKEVLKKNFNEYEIIVVDDASNDDTPGMLEKVNEIVVVSHRNNRGAGGARKSGIKESKYDIIVMLDGDATYPADKITDLVQELKYYDMAVGARTSEKGYFKLLRVPAKFFIRQLVIFITAKKIPDLNSGLRAFRKKDVTRFLDILPDTHSFVSSVTVAYMCNGYRVKYIPCDYYKRKGSSTFHPVKDTLTYLNLVVFTVLFFKPLKFFAPLSFILGIWGAVRLIMQSAAIGHLRLREGTLMLLLSAIIILTLGLLADMIVKLNRHRYMKDME